MDAESDDTHRYVVSCGARRAVLGEMEARYETWTAGRPRSGGRPTVSRRRQSVPGLEEQVRVLYA